MRHKEWNRCVFHLNRNAAGWKRRKQFENHISCLCLWVQLENLSGPAKVLTVSNVEVAI